MTQSINPPTLNFRTKSVIFITVLFGFIGLTLPYPIFGPMFLSANSGFLSTELSNTTRMLLLGLTLSIYPFGQFLGSPLLGKFSDHYGRRKVLILSLFATAISCVVIGISIHLQHLWLMLVSLFIWGFFEGNVAIAQSTMADLSTPQTKAKNFGILIIAVNLGWVIGPLVGGKLTTNNTVSWFTYSTPFYFASLLALGNLLLAFFNFPETSTLNKQRLELFTILTTFVTNIKRIDLRFFYAYGFLGFLCGYFYFNFFSPFLVERFHMGSAEIANFAAYFSIPLIAANYCIDFLTARLGLVRMGIYAHILLAISIIIFILPTSPIALWFTIIPIGIMLTISQVSGSVLASNAAGKEEQGTVMGVYRSLQVLSEMLAALIGGLLATISINMPFIISAGFASAASLLLIFLISKSHLSES